MEEFYCCLYFNENEHYKTQDELQTLADYFGCNLVYYRKLKNGHIPMYRECKLAGPAGKLKTIARAITDYLDESIVSNPHKGA